MSMRTFGLNSSEFYEAVSAPEERPCMRNGGLPREPRRERAMIGGDVSNAAAGKRR